MEKRNEEHQDGDLKEVEKSHENEVEGYSYCATDKQRCMQDCNGTAFLSTLN